MPSSQRVMKVDQPPSGKYKECASAGLAHAHRLTYPAQHAAGTQANRVIAQPVRADAAADGH